MPDCKEANIHAMPCHAMPCHVCDHGEKGGFYMGGFRSVVCTMCVEIADFCKLDAIFKKIFKK